MKLLSTIVLVSITLSSCYQQSRSDSDLKDKIARFEIRVRNLENELAEYQRPVAISKKIKKDAKNGSREVSQSFSWVPSSPAPLKHNSRSSISQWFCIAQGVKLLPRKDHGSSGPEAIAGSTVDD